MNAVLSPKLEKISWGQIEVAGFGSFKDVKVYPGGAREWDWRETNTHHRPGIQTLDIQELLDHGAEEVVLSRGMLNALHVCPETLLALEEKNILVHVLETKHAVKKYNLLRESVAVAGLFHSTC